MIPLVFVAVLAALAGALIVALAAWRIGPKLVASLANDFMGGVMRGWRRG